MARTWLITGSYPCLGGRSSRRSWTGGTTRVATARRPGQLATSWPATAAGSGLWPRCH